MIGDPAREGSAGESEIERTFPEQMKQEGSDGCPSKREPSWRTLMTVVVFMSM
jgi:hypothetical protein